MSVNKVILVGNLGADPESRTTGSGLVVTGLRLATTSRVKEGDQYVDSTEWHRVSCFGRTAENAARFLKKGRQVYVEGKIKTRKWTDKDGIDRWTTEILADVVTYLRDGSGGGGERREDSGGHGHTDPAPAGGGADDDIPF